jgi:hypothetical protein
MERSHFGKYVLFAIALFFILAGDYPSFFHHIKAII